MTPNVERNLILLLAAIEHARLVIGERARVVPTATRIQEALVILLGMDNPTDLLAKEWTADEILGVVEPVDFSAWEDFEDIELDLTESIIPDGVPRCLVEETVAFRGEIWRIHKYDPDPFPSLPHAHNLFDGLKMDLRNGNLYRKRELVDRLPRRRLEEFRGRVQRISLPALDVAIWPSILALRKFYWRVRLR